MKTWFHYHWKYNRRWMLIAVGLSLAGSALALLIGYYGDAFYSYAPSSYEPKDEARRLQLEQVQRSQK